MVAEGTCLCNDNDHGATARCGTCVPCVLAPQQKLWRTAVSPSVTVNPHHSHEHIPVLQPTPLTSLHACACVVIPTPTATSTPQTSSLFLEDRDARDPDPRDFLLLRRSFELQHHRSETNNTKKQAPVRYTLTHRPRTPPPTPQYTQNATRTSFSACPSSLRPSMTTTWCPVVAPTRSTHTYTSSTRTTPHRPHRHNNSTHSSTEAHARAHAAPLAVRVSHHLPAPPHTQASV